MVLYLSVMLGLGIRPFGRRLSRPARYRSSTSFPSFSQKYLSTPRLLVACFTVSCGRPPAPLCLAAMAIPSRTPILHRATPLCARPSRPSIAAPHFALAHCGHDVHPASPAGTSSPTVSRRHHGRSMLQQRMIQVF
jgi:hypothetical protein